MARTKVTSKKQKAEEEAAGRPTAAKKVPRRELASAKAPKTSIAKIKKPHRWRPGTVALREIRRYQKSCESLIPLAPFRRLFREIMQQFDPDSKYRVAFDTVLAAREASEYHLIKYFEKMNFAAVHANRVTVMPKDSHFVVNNAQYDNDPAFYSAGTDLHFDNGLVTMDSLQRARAVAATESTKKRAEPKAKKEDEKEEDDEEEEEKEEEKKDDGKKPEEAAAPVDEFGAE